jgi:hypothetical protein
MGVATFFLRLQILTGRLTMVRALLVAALAALASASHSDAQKAQQAADIAEAEVAETTASLVGDWVGRIGFGDEAYKVVLHVERLENGILRATGESSDTGASGVESLAVVVNEGSVRIEFEGARFVGDWNASTSTWEGYWRNGDEGVPMTLARS